MTVLEMKVEALMKCVDQDKFEKAMAEVGAAYFGTTDTDTSNKNTLRREIKYHLAKLGVPAHLKGYRHLVCALEFAVANEDLLEAITGELYPAVAKQLNTTPSRVERAIRHAVETAWNRGDVDTLIEYFGNTVSPSRGKTTNSEFIARLSNIIRDHMM